MNLERLAASHRKARAVEETARLALYEGIRGAHADGATLRALAAQTGLSFARIHQICRGRPRDKTAPGLS